VGHSGFSEWTGGVLLTQSQTPLTISNFMESEVPETLHLDSRYCEVRSPDRSEVALKSQISRVYQSFSKSGFGSQGDKFLDITTAKIVIGKIPKGKRKRSALTVFGFRGFKRPTLDLRTRKSAKSNLLSVKRGSHESLLWV
jgi:hypothetical protein